MVAGGPGAATGTRARSRGRTAAQALALVAAGGLLASCAAGPPAAAPNRPASPGATHQAATGPTAPTADTGPVCPLTGTPAPGGKVPRRSALAVKVDNYPTARPQTGLTGADIVFEEPVEGTITRYVAVFQCHGATVGPVRSARNIDIGILGQFGHPLLVHVGGIQPVISDIEASPLSDFELGAYTSVIQHPAGRVAPYDTYTSTTAIWQIRGTADTPPQPVLTYSSKVPAGSAVQSVSIPFSVYSPVDWRYDAKEQRFLRYYRTAPDTLANGVQNSAANVIVQFVHVTYGPWTENTEGGLEVQANLSTHASGDALVFRDGVEIQGQWARTTLGQPTRFTTTSGAAIAMAPGTTWVELVPSTVSVTATPAG
jgi:hypothetical protein